jgi:hypothetical protein
MDITALAAPFPPEAVSWRVGSTTADKSKGMALAYIDARDVQDRLTEVCGSFGWQCRHEVSHDKRITCHIGIRNPETGEWCWRSDGAGETDYEAEKGSYSDSFKRAAVKWGVGRYLYDIPSPWVAIEMKGKTAVIPDSEKARLASLLAKVGGKQPQLQTVAAAPSRPRDAAPTPSPPSRHFENLKATLDAIHTEVGMHTWEEDVRSAVASGNVSAGERATLLTLRVNKLSLLAQRPAA